MISSFVLFERKCPNLPNEDEHGTTNDTNDNSSTLVVDRRSLLGCLALTAFPHVANSYYERIYPKELQATDEGTMDNRQRRINQIYEQGKKDSLSSPLTRQPVASKILGSLLWGTALWLMSGSRSTPLATPVANMLYDETEESWLKDRNEGHFADLPLPLLMLLGVVFAILGVGVDALTVLVAGGDRRLSLELASIGIIGGAFLELGRVASGEKKLTRVESDREILLKKEFADFAANRLKPGGNIHRNEVVAAFRRYYAKYRQPDNPTSPLTDLEIEQLLRSWSFHNTNITMSSAGFFTGIQINRDADAFVNTRAL
jgi:hypothetical protein